MLSKSARPVHDSEQYTVVDVTKLNRPATALAPFRAPAQYQVDSTRKRADFATLFRRHRGTIFHSNQVKFDARRPAEFSQNWL